MVKKIISEFVGTMLLVIFGCGTAILFGNNDILLTAFAFGLVLMALVGTIGKVSGAHVNPAVSLAMWIDGRINVFELIEYICVQVMGGLAGAGVLKLIFGSNVAKFGANGYDSLSMLSGICTLYVALAIEALLTFVFVLVVLSVTDGKKNENPGLVIGLALTLVHLFGIPFTGTSVNPARSIGPALIQGGEALTQLWVFVVAPLVGGLLAALFYKFVIKEKKTLDEEVEEEPKVKKVAKKA